VKIKHKQIGIKKEKEAQLLRLLIFSKRVISKNPIIKLTSNLKNLNLKTIKI